ncbi:mitochondrial carrier domain-containing protein [Baffinella frigidus]|nr:mitochondrial carrier domain-containing protein [Cryptophyta sp. CCMP2293]
MPAPSMPPPPRTPCRARSSSSLCKVGLLVLLALFHPSSAMHPIVGNLARGSMLRISADLSGGLPLDHWKTRSVRFPNESPVESFKAIWIHQGGGPSAYWKGLPAKVVEGSMCGAVLMAAKEGTRSALLKARVPLAEAAIGAISGMAGGVAQTLVLAPTTMLIMTAATCNQPVGDTALQFIRRERPLSDLWTGGGPLALREASNWASRVGITDLVRNSMLRKGAPAGVALEISSGVLGGVLACWNNPFEVVRIRHQRDLALIQAGGLAGLRGEGGKGPAPVLGEGTWQTMRRVADEEGVEALFLTGIVPRCCLSAWLTCFMVVAPRFI